MNRTRPSLLAGLLAATALLSSGSAWSQVTVRDAWVRATVPGQQATGLFATLQAEGNSALVGAESAAAATVEIHEMRMDGEVMRMRAIERLPLPAGQPVALKPGSFHLMLMGVKRPLSDGSTVAVTLQIDTGGKTETVLLEAPVRRTAPAGASAGQDHNHGGAHDAHHMH